MTAVTTITTASHTAYLDPITGEGLLVLPNPLEDMRDPFSAGSLNESDWGAMMQRLDSLGWEPSEGVDGSLVEVGSTRDGNTVVGLFGLDPIHTEP